MDTTPDVVIDPKVVQPYIGERVLVVPQSKHELLSIHRPDTSLIGQLAHTLTPVQGDRATDAGSVEERLTLPCWESYNRDTLHHGYGLLVVRRGRFRLGPTWWDSGD